MINLLILVRFEVARCVSSPKSGARFALTTRASTPTSRPDTGGSTFPPVTAGGLNARTSVCFEWTLLTRLLPVRLDVASLGIESAGAMIGTIAADFALESPNRELTVSAI